MRVIKNSFAAAFGKLTCRRAPGATRMSVHHTQEVHPPFSMSGTKTRTIITLSTGLSIDTLLTNSNWQLPLFVQRAFQQLILFSLTTHGATHFTCYDDMPGLWPRLAWFPWWKLLVPSAMNNSLSSLLFYPRLRLLLYLFAIYYTRAWFPPLATIYSPNSEEWDANQLVRPRKLI